ncbi:hypothetical protein B0T22DRAFT_521521 [Podospora appendiculata]|uniref:Uncharacterized protein n=1 Tax=Podospora appendiculata TaxID=314037 RepID=A0AAE0X0S4_9PEZI|nr:hypothetical protein B0T22DRAFT_521521 [Podospora appendiculata]
MAEPSDPEMDKETVRQESRGDKTSQLDAPESAPTTQAETSKPAASEDTIDEEKLKARMNYTISYTQHTGTLDEVWAKIRAECEREIKEEIAIWGPKAAEVDEKELWDMIQKSIPSASGTSDPIHTVVSKLKTDCLRQMMEEDPNGNGKGKETGQTGLFLGGSGKHTTVRPPSQPAQNQAQTFNNDRPRIPSPFYQESPPPSSQEHETSSSLWSVKTRTSQRPPSRPAFGIGSLTPAPGTGLFGLSVGNPAAQTSATTKAEADPHTSNVPKKTESKEENKPGKPPGWGRPPIPSWVKTSETDKYLKGELTSWFVRDEKHEQEVKKLMDKTSSHDFATQGSHVNVDPRWIAADGTVIPPELRGQSIIWRQMGVESPPPPPGNSGSLFGTRSLPGKDSTPQSFSSSNSLFGATASSGLGHQATPNISKGPRWPFGTNILSPAPDNAPGLSPRQSDHRHLPNTTTTFFDPLFFPEKSVAPGSLPYKADSKPIATGDPFPPADNSGTLPVVFPTPPTPKSTSTILEQTPRDQTSSRGKSPSPFKFPLDEGALVAGCLAILEHYKGNPSRTQTTRDNTELNHYLAAGTCKNELPPLLPVILLQPEAQGSSQPAPQVSESFPAYRFAESLNELGAYIANASYIISIGGSPLEDMNYGIIIVPAGEEALLFNQPSSSATNRDFLDAVHDANREYQKQERSRRHRRARERDHSAEPRFDERRFADRESDGHRRAVARPTVEDEDDDIDNFTTYKGKGNNKRTHQEISTIDDSDEETIPKSSRQAARRHDNKRAKHMYKHNEVLTIDFDSEFSDEARPKNKGKEVVHDDCHTRKEPDQVFPRTKGEEAAHRSNQTTKHPRKEVIVLSDSEEEENGPPKSKGKGKEAPRDDDKEATTPKIKQEPISDADGPSGTNESPIRKIKTEIVNEEWEGFPEDIIDVDEAAQNAPVEEEQQDRAETDGGSETHPKVKQEPIEAPAMTNSAAAPHAGDVEEIPQMVTRSAARRAREASSSKPQGVVKRKEAAPRLGAGSTSSRRG